MTTVSFPAVGNGGLTEAEWESMWDGSDGVYNDYDGSSFAVTAVNSTNSVTVGPVGAIAAVDGYFIRITALETIAVPTAVGSYFLAVMYDPTLNVADGSGNASTAGPCRFVVTTGTPSTAGGKKYLLLRKYTRSTAGAALTSLPVLTYAPHIGPNLTISDMPQSFTTDPPTDLVGMQYPVGTRVYEASTGEHWQLDVDPTGGTQWVRQSMSTVLDFPANSPLAAVNSTDTPKYYYTNFNAVVHFEGTLQRVSGAALTSTSADVQLGTMPPAAHPKKPVRRAVLAKVAGGYTTGYVLVDTDGTVTLYFSGNTGIQWVSLDGISYRVRS